VQDESAIFGCLATATVLLGAIDGRAQNADPPAAVGLPDACKLRPQSDLEALFPGMSITSNGAMLSPVYQGPQWNQGSTYNVKLPSPTSKMFFANFISLSVIKCNLCNAKDKISAMFSAAQTLANMRDTQVMSIPGLAIGSPWSPEIGVEIIPSMLIGQRREALLPSISFL
jgi:hypothetical protein